MKLSIIIFINACLQGQNRYILKTRVPQWSFLVFRGVGRECCFYVSRHTLMTMLILIHVTVGDGGTTVHWSIFWQVTLYNRWLFATWRGGLTRSFSCQQLCDHMEQHRIPINLFFLWCGKLQILTFKIRKIINKRMELIN